MAARADSMGAVSELDHIVMDQKLKRFMEFEQEAVPYLIEWLQHHPEGLIAMARGRYVAGLLRWGDSNWGEHTADDLMVEASEELADGIVYLVEVLQRQKYGVRATK